MSRLAFGVAKLSVFVACLTPFVLIGMRAFEVGDMTLGPNPIDVVVHTMGKTSLNILLISLSISPARRLLHYNFLIRFRRMIGLFSFFYLTMHFTAYAVLDLALAWDTLLEDILERPYITVGMLAFVLMIPLAITSTKAMQRRLKRRWTTLHRSVYVIATLAVVHYFWQTKLDTLEPTIYAAILMLLLGERITRHTMRRRRTRVSTA
jgi:sulfoxide reductase heme-binding subunit YedZ